MALQNRAVDTDLRAPISNVDPASGAVAVTKHDTNDIWGDTFNRVTSRACRALYVGGAGDIKATMADGTEATFTAVPIGFAPLRIKKLWSTGTSATLVIALI